MRPHDWSFPLCVYETTSMFKCRWCSAVIMSIDDGPTAEDLKHARLPVDCDEAVLVVIHDDYVSGETESWLGDDRFEWKTVLTYKFPIQ